MGHFDSLGEALAKAAASGGGGVFLLPGKYLVQVRKVIIKQSSKSVMKEYFIVEFDILESSNEDRPAGSQATWLQEVSHEMGMPNIKRFLCCVHDIDPNDEEAIADVGLDKSQTCKNLLETISEDETYLTGQQLRAVCDTIITKKEKKPFDRVLWHPVSAELGG